MCTHLTPVEVARAFTEAWTSHDMDAAAEFLAPDVVYDAPANRVVGVEDCIEALSRFARAVTGLEIIAGFGDNEQPIVMDEVSTGPFGSVRCGECITVRDGRIQTDLLAFDTFAVRIANVASASE